MNFLEDGFVGLTFFDFTEMVYLVAQYFNPDLLVNSNQKFADFVEKVILLNIQFIVKNKKIPDSIHKERLAKAL